MHLGQRAEEVIDRHVPAERTLQVDQPEVAVVHGKRLARRDDVHLVHAERYGFDHLRDPHGRVPLQDLVDAAFVLGRQVHHDDDGHAGLAGQPVQQALQGAKAAGRCADAHHGERQLAGPDVGIGLGVDGMSRRSHASPAHVILRLSPERVGTTQSPEGKGRRARTRAAVGRR
jgi:hypothetical protein